LGVVGRSEELVRQRCRTQHWMPSPAVELRNDHGRPGRRVLVTVANLENGGGVNGWQVDQTEKKTVESPLERRKAALERRKHAAIGIRPLTATLGGRRLHANRRGMMADHGNDGITIRRV
jgi:hypothetical protein